MPGFLVHVGAQVLCLHGGQAQPELLRGKDVRRDVPLVGIGIDRGTGDPSPESSNHAQHGRPRYLLLSSILLQA